LKWINRAFWRLVRHSLANGIGVFCTSDTVDFTPFGVRIHGFCQAPSGRRP
jgi:hypothetical protein